MRQSGQKRGWISQVPVVTRVGAASASQLPAVIVVNMGPGGDRATMAPTSGARTGRNCSASGS